MEGCNTNWPPTSGNVNDAHTGSSFASLSSTYPSMMIHIPPLLDYLRPDTPPCSPPFVPDDLPPHAQSCIAQFDSSPQHDAPAYFPPSSTSHEYDFLSQYDPRQAELRNDSPAIPHQGIPGQYQSGMVGGYRSSLAEALSYSQLSPTLGPPRPQAGVDYYSQPQHPLGGMTMGVEREHTDIAIPHFELMNDTWTMWANVRPSTGCVTPSCLRALGVSKLIHPLCFGQACRLGQARWRRK